MGIFSRWHNVEMHMGPPSNIEPPDFEPLDSPLRQEELRYETPSDLWKMWSDKTRAASVEENSHGEQALTVVCQCCAIHGVVFSHTLLSEAHFLIRFRLARGCRHD